MNILAVAVRRGCAQTLRRPQLLLPAVPIQASVRCSQQQLKMSYWWLTWCSQYRPAACRRGRIRSPCHGSFGTPFNVYLWPPCFQEPLRVRLFTLLFSFKSAAAVFICWVKTMNYLLLYKLEQKISPDRITQWRRDLTAPDHLTRCCHRPLVEGCSHGRVWNHPFIPSVLRQLGCTPLCRVVGMLSEDGRSLFSALNISHCGGSSVQPRRPNHVPLI